jgi:hypothetical protein
LKIRARARCVGGLLEPTDARDADRQPRVARRDAVAVAVAVAFARAIVS